MNVLGVWFFHCHITWHLATGLAVTLIEAPLDLQKNLTIPQSHKDVCAAAGIATTGNAAGNTEDYLDLVGQNMEMRPLPAGFTTKGYVAMAFSCLSGGLGLVAIAW
jgi:iron transport multicopper oxidase